MGGLIGGDPAGAAGGYHTMGAPQHGTGHGQPGGVATTVDTRPVDGQAFAGRFDSFFAASSWSREDIMLMASVAQLILFVATAWAVVRS